MMINQQRNIVCDTFKFYFFYFVVSSFFNEICSKIYRFVFQKWTIGCCEIKMKSILWSGLTIIMLLFIDENEWNKQKNSNVYIFEFLHLFSKLKFQIFKYSNVIVIYLFDFFLLICTIFCY